MEAMYENPFQQCKDDHKNLQHDQDFSTVEDEGVLPLDSQHEIHEIDQQVGEFHMAESDERKGVVLDWSIEENKVLGPNVLMSLEQSLHKEVVQSAHGQQDENFFQVSEKPSLDEFMVDDKNVSVEFQESSEVAFLMIDECDECNENLVVISCQDDQKYIQTIADQTIMDSISDSSSYVSCFEVFFEEEIHLSTCLEFFEDQEHTFSEVHYEGRSESKEKDILFLQHEVNLHVFHDPMANLLQSAVKVIIAVFNDEGDHGQLCFGRPSYQYQLLTRRYDRKNQSRSHILDWLHW